MDLVLDKAKTQKVSQPDSCTSASVVDWVRENLRYFVSLVHPLYDPQHTCPWVPRDGGGVQGYPGDGRHYWR